MKIFIDSNVLIAAYISACFSVNVAINSGGEDPILLTSPPTASRSLTGQSFNCRTLLAYFFESCKDLPCATPTWVFPGMTYMPNACLHGSFMAGTFNRLPFIK
jgi:hypothetical protein